MPTTFYSLLDSPLEPLLLTSDGVALTGLYMVDHTYGPPIAPDWVQANEATPFYAAKEQINAYFAGELTHFALPLAPHGTDFQQRVWAALQEIPYGVTTSYGELARRVMGSVNGSRAVGLANGRNPISIIVPCHRVIGANGQLTGYGGGLPRKTALLAFESSVQMRGPQPFPHVGEALAPNLAQGKLFM